MGKALDERVITLKQKKSSDEINGLIESYQPFILNVITQTKNAYVDLDNDEEFSIGLIAFHEAIERYEMNRGDFLSFARTVITSRLKDYWERESKKVHHNFDESDMVEDGFDEQLHLRNEINEFRKSLMGFGLTFEILEKETPKHIDTRKKALEIGFATSKEADLVNHLYEKKRLPITKIALRFAVTKKIIKRSKCFITALVIVAEEKYEHILAWIG